MRFLITGGNGFIGSNLTKLIRSYGHHVDIFDKKSKISLDEAVSECPDVIIHLAAFVRNQDDNKHIRDIILTQNLLDAVTLYSPDSRVVFSSTVNVYKSPSVIGCTEDFDVRPRTLYEHSKLINEYIVSKHSNYVILRLSNVFGEGMKHGVIKDWLEKTDVTIMDKPPYSTRCFVDIDYVTKCFYKVATHEEKINDTFNICGPEYINLFQLAEILQIPIKSTEQRDSTILLPSGSKFENKMGMVCNTNISLEIHKLKFKGKRP